MEGLEQQIEKLNQLDEYWIRFVKEKNGEENPELDREIRKFFRIAKEAYKEDKDAVEDLLTRWYKEEAACLLDTIRDMLSIYFALFELRKLQKDDTEQGRKIIDFVFYNGILRFDPWLPRQYSEYGFEKPDEIIRTSQALTALTRYYIEHRFTVEAIRRDLYMETDFEEEICSYLAKLIDKNYLQLQLNITLSAVNEMMNLK